MFISILRPAVEPFGPDAVATPGSPFIPAETARALHARLLANAAARRRRAMERREARRDEDYDYWLHAAPAAVERAAALREEGLEALP